MKKLSLLMSVVAFAAGMTLSSCGSCCGSCGSKGKTAKSCPNGCACAKCQVTPSTLK